ncbi:MAG: hypothetical protein ABMB14_06510 [Myxococcota bacterium]
MVRQSQPSIRRSRPAEPLTVRAISGWVFLTVFVVGLVGVAITVFAVGLPYYLIPELARVDHPLDEWFAPGAAVGLLLGMVGAGLMTMILLYSVRKWLPLTAFMGTTRFWMRFHLVCGLLGPLFIVLHGAFIMPSGFIGVGFWVMLLVAASGFFGRYLFGYFPATASDRRVDFEEAQLRLADLRAQLVADTRSAQSSHVSEAVCLARDAELEATTLVGLVVLDAEVRRRCDLIQVLLHRAGLEPDVRRRAEATLIEQLSLRREIAGFDVARRLLRFWNLLHQPLALAMYAIAALHILNAVLFGGVVPVLLRAL